jgi:hypothetical protein
MAGIPKVKITFDADFDELKKGVKGAQTEVEGFSSKIGKFGKVAAAAFAAATVAAAAYAGKLLIDGVKAAIEDEKANALLANTLRNVAGATQETIDKTLEYTRATELATGVTEDELRPSLNRLTIATKSVEKAMDLQTIALDIAAGSGKSLDAVSQALAKAYEGNTASLGRLGIGLSSAQLKTMSMEQITESLARTFNGAASTAANTYEGKMARLGLAFEDVRDTVGGFVLDALTPLVSNFVDKGMPAIKDFADGLSTSLGPAFTSIFKVVRDDLLPIVKAVFNFLANEFIPALGAIFGPALRGLANAFNIIKNAVASNSDELAPLLSLFKAVWTFTKDNLAPILGGAFKIALEGIATLIGGLVTAFSKFVALLTGIYNGAKKVIDLIKDNPITNLFDGGAKGLKASVPFPEEIGGGVTVETGFGDGGGTFAPNAGSPTFTGAPLSAYSPAMQAAILRREELKAETARLRAAREGTGVPITVNMGIVGDPESAARTIIDVVNKSQARGTLGAGSFLTA